VSARVSEWGWRRTEAEGLGDGDQTMNRHTQLTCHNAFLYTVALSIVVAHSCCC